MKVSKIVGEFYRDLGAFHDADGWIRVSATDTF